MVSMAGLAVALDDDHCLLSPFFSFFFYLSPVIFLFLLFFIEIFPASVFGWDGRELSLEFILGLMSYVSSRN